VLSFFNARSGFLLLRQELTKQMGQLWWNWSFSKNLVWNSFFQSLRQESGNTLGTPVDSGLSAVSGDFLVSYYVCFRNWLAGVAVSMVFRNSTGSLDCWLTSVCLETRCLGQKSLFLSHGTTLYWKVLQMNLFISINNICHCTITITITKRAGPRVVDRNVCVCVCVCVFMYAHTCSFIYVLICMCSYIYIVHPYVYFGVKKRP